MSIRDRLSHAWNAFLGRDPTNVYDYRQLGTSTYYPTDKPRLTYGNDRSIVNSILTRIAVDTASNKIRHVKTDTNGKYIEEVTSDLNYCLKTGANIDQASSAFIEDVVLTMLDTGVVVLVPIITDFNPQETAFDIRNMRCGKVVEWYPQHVKVNVYNEWKGDREDIVVPKEQVSIIQNPLYSIMNDRNSILQRLIRKLNLLDTIDEQSGSGKLDLIIGLPYLIRSDARKAQAEQRRSELENQLMNSKYGVAYTDGTEKITQLNRPVENNIMKQVEYLTSMLYSQLGMTASVFDGTADEETMLNYNTRTIQPILVAITEEMSRKFLTKNARTRGETIMFFSDPFKLTTVTNIANIADTFTRNAIMSSNEIRSLIGLKPVNDPRADELRNKNLNESPNQGMGPLTTDEQSQDFPVELDSSLNE